MNHPDQKKPAIEISQFSQVFFEECVEHLAEMEHILVSLGENDPDDEQLNAIFRAAHSIKGGAGMFGFQDMTIVTHVLESLLDKLRTHEIHFSSSMIDLFLEAGDVIAMQLAGHRNGTEFSEEAVDRIRDKLQQVIEGGGLSHDAAAVPKEKTAQGDDRGVTSTQSSTHLYQLTFTPDSNIFERGIRLENLFADLKELGSLEVKAQVSVPEDLHAFDPKECVTL